MFAQRLSARMVSVVIPRCFSSVTHPHFILLQLEGEPGKVQEFYQGKQLMHWCNTTGVSDMTSVEADGSTNMTECAVKAFLNLAYLKQLHVDGCCDGRTYFWGARPSTENMP